MVSEPQVHVRVRVQRVRVQLVRVRATSSNDRPVNNPRMDDDSSSYTYDYSSRISRIKHSARRAQIVIDLHITTG